MHIRASLRPSGIKKGVRTETLYKRMGLKEAPDLRDVIGKLELNARGPNDTIFLAALHKALGGFYGSGKVVVYDKNGEIAVTYENGASNDADRND